MHIFVSYAPVHTCMQKRKSVIYPMREGPIFQIQQMYLIRETSTLATGSDLNLFVPDQEGDELWGDIATRV